MLNKKLCPLFLAVSALTVQISHADDTLPFSIQGEVSKEQRVFKDGTIRETNAKKLQQQLNNANWQNKKTDVGNSSDVAIRKYGTGIKREEVIVAVIDSGVDISHPDLKGQIWVNKREVPNDGIDNDGNGYVDDVNGWSFLGKNQTYANLEMTRMYRDKTLKYRNDYSKLTNDDTYTKDTYQEEYRNATSPTDLDYYLNLDFNPLTTVDPDDSYSAIRDFPSIKHPFYGNNDVTGTDADHGTHVAGIIAAKRGNGKGNLVTDGIAPQAKIMSIRVVPDGDERDEDIANGVRYAVDNGAKIINMSFGKGFSPAQKQVAKAFEYAAKKGVLMVHAAGNDASDVGEVPNFPSRFKMSDRVKANWLEVGSSTSSYKRNDFVSYFSNFGGQTGKATVDLFSGGSAIISTVPNGGIASFSGTSMASPNVAGVAALIMSHAPEMTGAEVKSLIIETGNKHGKKQVLSPENRFVKFSELSVSGVTPNAEMALKKIYK